MNQLGPVKIKGVGIKGIYSNLFEWIANGCWVEKSI